MVLTGGGLSTDSVTRYNDQGWVEDIPKLIQGRNRHGCARYFDGAGAKVLSSIDLIFYKNSVFFVRLI